MKETRPGRSPAELAERLIQGDRTALARSITLIESDLPAHRILAAELLDRVLPRSGGSLRLGITGAPGVGKSTMIEALGKREIEAGRRLAVLAVDPSSQSTGGSILGDKSRMPFLSAHRSAFVRPSPAGKTLGGVAAATREAMVLCEAAGFDRVWVETVGVGQSETAVAGMVDCFLLLVLPGAGDELQGIKRGIMELADVLAITKADGDNRVRAKVSRQQAINALHFFSPDPDGWTPPVHLCSAVTGEGLPELMGDVERFADHRRASGGFEQRRREQSIAHLRELVRQEALDRTLRAPEAAARLARLEVEVAGRRISPRTGAMRFFGE